MTPALASSSRATSWLISLSSTSSTRAPRRLTRRLGLLVAPTCARAAVDLAARRRAEHGVEQGGRADTAWSGHPPSSSPAASCSGILPPVGGDHDHGRRVARRRARLQRPRRLDAVHARHLPVHQHQTVGIASWPSRSPPPPCAAAPSAAAVTCMPKDSSMVAQDLAGGRVVVDHQRAKPLQASPAGSRMLSVALQLTAEAWR